MQQELDSSGSSPLDGASRRSWSDASSSNQTTADNNTKSVLNQSISVRNINLQQIFAENILAKIFQVAERGLRTQGSLPSYPHTVPQSGPCMGQYEHREADFWTCGFFPGSIYALLERTAKFPAHLDAPGWYRKHAYQDLLALGRHWSIAINDMSGRTDTHDMGFIVQPALQKDWELTGNPESLESVTKAAYALASRYSHTVGAIRSWDRAINYRYSIEDMSENFLVIIDSMCNLDLLYYVGHLVQDDRLTSIATTHADTVRRVLVRDDYSTFHLANLDTRKGTVQSQMTNQGHQDSSTWSRGQAWAIMGFAQTYQWTREPKYLETAIGCANAFLSRLGAAQHHHPFVPAWDFDAPQQNSSDPLRDTSAGVVAANGMLLIHQGLQTLAENSACPPNQPEHRPTAGGNDFLDAALSIVRHTLEMSLDRDFASIMPPPASTSDLSLAATTGHVLHCAIESSPFDAILRNATANNNEHAHQKYWDHGLVYADYFLLEFGNKLCRMGLC